ncbi:MAG: pyridoxal phosphate-dependent aminotransferase [Spirochaetia bacterium]|jgi:cystathionine beta-lyase|nr:pyridoxal phosphate-dependent aminotransferase [Spirochaetia bacterium]
MNYDFDTVIDRHNTDCLKWDHNKITYGTDDILPLWVADMDFKVPDAVLDAMQKRLEHGVFGYTYRSGRYNHIISEWVERQYGWHIHDDWITFSPGVVPAMALSLLAVTRPGDAVMILSPVYGPFSHVVTNNGRKLIDCLMDKDENGRYAFDIDKMESLVDKRLKVLMICNPHNPVGRVWSKEELLQLEQFAQRHDLLVISDEIHADFTFKGHKHIPFASLTPYAESHTIACYAPSKTFGLAGLSTSYIVIPDPKIRQAFDDILYSLEVDNGNIFGFVALEAAFTKCDDWLEQLLDYLEANRDYACDFFKERIPQIQVWKPEATYLLWLNCERLGFKDNKELDAFFINNAKIGCNRGVRFSPSSEQYMRLNFGCPRSLLTQGLEQLEQAVKALGAEQK